MNQKDDLKENGKKVLSAMEHIDSDLITEAAPKKDPAETILRIHANRRAIYTGILAAGALIVGGITIGIALNNGPKPNPEDQLAHLATTEEDTSELLGKIEESEVAPKKEPSHLETTSPRSTDPSPEGISKMTGETPPVTPHSPASLPDGIEVPPSPDHSSTEFELAPNIGGEEYILSEDPIPGEVFRVDKPDERPELPDDGKTDLPDDGKTTPPIEDKFGILTAGRWNDNSNWGFFRNLVNTGAISFPSYGLNPVYRSSVTVKNEDGTTLPGLKVEAVYSDDGSHIFYGMTNDEGTAYLFLPSSEDRTWQIRVYDTDDQVVYTGTDPYDLPGAAEEDVPDSQKRGRNYPETIDLTIDTESRTYQETQVMFLLDTTGSMGDELTYLQADFGKIMDRIETPNVSYSWNFYRDEGDDYVTLTNGFSTDRDELKKILNSQVSNGGGDLPEAVDVILTETMNSEDWKDNSKKIAFLIFDAPPHEEKKAEVAAATAKAAERGIHIVPIVSSNSERDTELFGRALAIMTDGEYVFLTDDSGVGESHLEPIIGDYEVQKLEDVIVDIINEYSAKAE